MAVDFNGNWYPDDTTYSPNFMSGQYGAPGQNLTDITTNGGRTVRVNSVAAPYFRGFLNDLEAAGAPLASIGGYGYRSIAGTDRLSQHAYGNALDLNQSGRNEVSPDFLAWAQAHPDALNTAVAKWGMVNGGAWKHPDFGHFEWSGRGAPPPSININTNPHMADLDPTDSAMQQAIASLAKPNDHGMGSLERAGIYLMSINNPSALQGLSAANHDAEQRNAMMLHLLALQQNHKQFLANQDRLGDFHADSEYQRQLTQYNHLMEEVGTGRFNGNTGEPIRMPRYQALGLPAPQYPYYAPGFSRGASGGFPGPAPGPAGAPVPTPAPTPVPSPPPSAPGPGGMLSASTPVPPPPSPSPDSVVRMPQSTATPIPTVPVSPTGDTGASAPVAPLSGTQAANPLGLADTADMSAWQANARRIGEARRAGWEPDQILNALPAEQSDYLRGLMTGQLDPRDYNRFGRGKGWLLGVQGYIPSLTGNNLDYYSKVYATRQKLETDLNSPNNARSLAGQLQSLRVLYGQTGNGIEDRGHLGSYIDTLGKLPTVEGVEGLTGGRPMTVPRIELPPIWPFHGAFPGITETDWARNRNRVILGQRENQGISAEASKVRDLILTDLQNVAAGGEGTGAERLAKAADIDVINPPSVMHGALNTILKFAGPRLDNLEAQIRNGLKNDPAAADKMVAELITPIRKAVANRIPELNATLGPDSAAQNRIDRNVTDPHVTGKIGPTPSFLHPLNPFHGNISDPGGTHPSLGPGHSSNLPTPSYALRRLADTIPSILWGG